jgi:CheY-like chemotaxis protein
MDIVLHRRSQRRAPISWILWRSRAEALINFAGEGGTMKTILVLEDDPSNMLAFSALLWSAGYNVLEATTGKEAIAAGKAHEGAVDLLVADVNVPEPSGTEVALQLVKSDLDMSVLLVSGTPMDSWSSNDLESFRQLPRDQVDFMEKPFWPMAFLDTIGELIQRRNQHANVCLKPKLT